MFGLLQKLRSQAGFTMIELLVVIAVIGVLAVAVLSSLNPIEQINKGRDTRSRSDATQLIGASDRYFSIHEKYPWNVQVTNGTIGTTTVNFTPPAGTPPGTDYASAFTFDEAAAGMTMDNWGWAVNLSDTQEVKTTFINRLANLNDNVAFYFHKPNGKNETMYACFKPASNAFQQEANDRCNPATGNSKFDSDLATKVPAACAASGATNCYANTTDTVVCMICLP